MAFLRATATRTKPSFVARERSPARFKARRPPAREDPGKERIERNMDKL
jgi:hypothetical protein